ncbi:MAG: zinc ribbon domain-containing protein [Candidatus Binataceae bacterium]|nr:zinc ribbon domain-containing protein [Candidatus Binataceae bacterium]
MPIYEYECAKCGVFEVTQRITENPLKKCPTCKSKVERILSRSSFILKGSGWYATDYAKSGTAAKTESKSDAKSDSSSASDSSSSSASSTGSASSGSSGTSATGNGGASGSSGGGSGGSNTVAKSSTEKSPASKPAA